MFIHFGCVETSSSAGRESVKDVPLGAKRCARQFRHTNTIPCGGWLRLSWREARDHWGVRCADGYEPPCCIQERRLDMAASYDGRDDHRSRAVEHRLYVRLRYLSLPQKVFESLPLYSLWNYNPDNDDTRGDDWNGENFSWFSNSRAQRYGASSSSSSQEQQQLDKGARILDAVVRPYPAKTAGLPLKFEYEMATGAFSYSWCDGGEEGVHARETEIFVPEQLARGRRLIVEGLSDGDAYKYDAARQTLFVVLPADADGVLVTRMVRLSVRFDPPVGGEMPNDFWSDFGRPVGAVSVVLLALVAYYLL